LFNRSSSGAIASLSPAAEKNFWWRNAAKITVVRKYEIREPSSCNFLQFVFVVKTADYRNRRHVMAVRNVMPTPPRKTPENPQAHLPKRIGES
jgi:hypothetical protein